ncbi:hypothetical protein JHW43_009189 [Diplocarpon mali]|nr:hypothetical protein JHW43_009189 [Diplocarpon mali]
MASSPPRRRDQERRSGLPTAIPSSSRIRSSRQRVQPWRDRLELSLDSRNASFRAPLPDLESWRLISEQPEEYKMHIQTGAQNSHVAGNDCRRVVAVLHSGVDQTKPGLDYGLGDASRSSWLGLDGDGRQTPASLAGLTGSRHGAVPTMKALDVAPVSVPDPQHSSHAKLPEAPSCARPTPSSRDVR